MDFRRLAIGLTAALLLNGAGAADEWSPENWGVEVPSAGAGSDHGPLTALARIDPASSRIADFGNNLLVELALSQPVPWRVFTLDAPRRLVLDFSEVDFAGTDLQALLSSDLVSNLYRGRFREGWSRMVIDLAQPMAIETAGLSTSGGVTALKLQLAPVSEAEFTAGTGVPESALFSLPLPSEHPAPVTRQRGERPLRVTLDPGHGGFDPGAEAGGMREADVMLTFAMELEQTLENAGMEVSLTRRGDSFVPLPTRVSVARAAKADLLLSIHADALEEGNASGAAAYTLSTTASDAASAKLAQRLDRGDMIAGIDLGTGDDAVASVLMDMARLETQPRAERLADEIVAGLARATGDLHKRPRLTGNFSVLRAADIPSVLLELGFLSSQQDRDRLSDPVWRARAIDGIRAGIEAWAREDAAEARRLMQ
ncbi:N-acetylmuramoyl-L-alanine amidase AmiC precursor [Rhodobacteraceae bacterium THAF1]|uniref:N-acetylmuramoyl-L-alanine amidase n=1 Tax=Palleronia sp. THAF1 TaxID=2587842 RepID=UPI000F404958|nr:N-acetylmuramoyl-L-alanine amidase [Palleronia sp. THAF1]QFU08614.1 N-acetylmuramoyl-L-alanine amidase AmiC precursor [Palleronia sp. THAF1]VDC30725.1 N-acetylmuramoyl-L-alanine amidase AmiC precursor [Rhodobacteraceae bacterium THAF1]